MQEKISSVPQNRHFKLVVLRKPALAESLGLAAFCGFENLGASCVGREKPSLFTLAH